MSVAARRTLVARLRFQDAQAPADLLSTSETQTQLIALLLELTQAYALEITSVRTDHDNDGALGLHTHANGYCADLWPLNTDVAGDYMDANDPRFAAFLRAAAASPWLWQIGLGGSAYTGANMDAAGPTAFHDNGQDHVHLGANGP